MTQEQREHACISLKVPKSGDPELDKLILESRRMDLAGKIMATGYTATTAESVARAILKAAGWVK